MTDDSPDRPDDALDRLNDALEGQYHVERQLGEGGMATVYLATDLKHERKVALKVLKPELAAVVGADRFLSEIKTTANLQHPHILPLHDSGEARSFLYYVMPYVQGESLRERLDRENQLAVDEAVRIATAIAGALDYAHRHGVIHRDIKPANILMQDDQPVVADFGIALAVGAAGGARLTETGLSVGTPFYMSPEQATGDVVVGPATDIYAVACVLYEMLVGEPPYLGKTAQAVLGKIISGEKVSVTKQRSTIPPNVDAAIRRALEKLPADRFQTADEFARALGNKAFRHGPAEEGAEAGVARRPAPAALAATAVLSLAAGAVGWALLGPTPEARVSRYSVNLPEGHSPAEFFGSNLTISPDGSIIAYAGPTEGEPSQLWLRRRDQLNPQPVPGTVGAMNPAFSPDGTRIAFHADGSLKVVSLGGEPPLTLAEGIDPAGISWGEDGYVYFDHVGLPLGRVPESGGELEPITAPDTATGEGAHLWPQALPGGRGLLFTVARTPTSNVEQYDLAVADLETGTHTILVRGVTGRYLASGHLLYVNAAGALLAAPFDVDGLALTGPAVSLLEGVGVQGFGSSDFAASREGTLVYTTGLTTTGAERAIWVDRNGEITPVDPEWEFDPGRPEVGVEVSPDGGRLAVKITSDAGEDIWVKELDRGPLSRLTFDDDVDRRPRWSSDGRWILFTSNRAGQFDLYRKPADGTGPAELVLDLERGILEVQRTPDDEWTLLRLGGQSNVTGLRDLVAVRGTDTTTVPIATEPYDEKAGALSPDGRWMAYESNETGRDEIYVRPFPNASDGKWQVSTGGGINPRWAHSGREIFYIGQNGMMAAADVTTDPTFRVGQRTTLFPVQRNGIFAGANYAGWDVAPDDQRFLMVQFVLGAESVVPELIVVENFFEDLHERMRD